MYTDRTPHTALYLPFYEVWDEVIPGASAVVRLLVVKMLRFIVVQRTISRLCFGISYYCNQRHFCVFDVTMLLFEEVAQFFVSWIEINLN